MSVSCTLRNINVRLLLQDAELRRGVFLFPRTTNSLLSSSGCILRSRRPFLHGPLESKCKVILHPIQCRLIRELMYPVLTTHLEVSILYAPTPLPPTHLETPPTSIRTEQVAISDRGPSLDSSTTKVRCGFACFASCSDGELLILHNGACAQSFLPVQSRRAS